MKTLIFFALLIMAGEISYSQSIIGRWQLVKQSTCVEDELGKEDDDTQALIDDMKGMSGASPQVLELRDNRTGQESTRIISKKKSYNSKSFLYRYDDSGLYFLDKKSRTIIEGYTVERLEGDSLIISNAAKVCETKVFVRIK
ncbi:MAG: hypothetical protein ABI477_21575 [Chryseolinea sp.]